MPARPPYRSTLSNLLTGVTAGMDPMVALQQLASAQDQQTAYLEQLEAEREEKQAEKQQRFATLADMVSQGAASGLSPQALQSQMDFMAQAVPGVGPRMEQRVEGLMDLAYPRQPGNFSDLPGSVAVKGTEAEIAQSLGDMVGPRPQTSPMYIPDRREQLELAQLEQDVAAGPGGMPDLTEIDIQTGTDPITDKPVTGPLGPVLSEGARQDKAAGRSMEESIEGAQSLALRQGIMDPTVLEAIAQQITLLWGTFPGPPGQGGQAVPSATQPRPRTPPRSPMFPGLVEAYGP